MANIDITVAICTYNGESRVPEVLDALGAQTDTDSILWDVLVIDNASQDNTGEIVQQYQKSTAYPYLLRCISEPKKGLAFARQRAIAEAEGKIVAFLDDDNIPTPSWIKHVADFAHQHPEVGAFGGKVHGQFETPPPENFEKIAMFLALTDRGEQAHCYRPQKRMLPPGAGLVVRRQAWLDNVPEQTLLKGRVNNSFVAGEDLEVLAHIQKAGWEIWYNPKMLIHHKIPKHRLDKKYLLSIAWGTGLCRHHIRMARYESWQKIILTPCHISNDVFVFLLSVFHFLSSPQKKLLGNFDLIYRLATVLSPFYFCSNFLLNYKSGD